MDSQERKIHFSRWVAALIMGVPVVVLATGAFYSLSGIHGGNYGAAFILAFAYGCALWLVYRIGGGRRISRVPMWLLLITTSTGPLVVGHSMGYGDMQSLAYRMVQEDTIGRYPEDWKQLNREDLFPHWVGKVTGSEGEGVSGYLRAQAAIGWEGIEKINKASTRIVRTGLRVWIAWTWHLIFFFTAGAIAFFAAIRQGADTSQAHAAAVRRDKVVSADNGIKEQRGGPEDLPEPAVWTDYNDQGHIYVSFQYEPRAGYASLREFFEARVRRSFQQSDEKYVEQDVNKYLERICIMKEISRAELVQFISTHYIGVTSKMPSVHDNLRSAILCRDEPETKEVIWETANGYWAMTWSRG